MRLEGEVAGIDLVVTIDSENETVKIDTKHGSGIDKARLRTVPEVAAYLTGLEAGVRLERDRIEKKAGEIMGNQNLMTAVEMFEKLELKIG